MVMVKDGIIVSLNNKIDELQKDRKNSSENSSPQIDEANNGKFENIAESGLKDSIVACKMQNEFLNREIFRLISCQKQLESKIGSGGWQKKCHQYHDKLLLLLEELNQAIGQSEMSDVNKNILIFNNSFLKSSVSRLFEKNSVRNSPSSQSKDSLEKIPASSHGEYDDLGFPIKQSDIDSDPVRKKISLSDPETTKNHFDWRIRWEIMLSSLESEELQPSLELKCLLRTGIPKEYRFKIWRMLIDFKVKPIKEKLGSNYYQKLTLKNAERKVNPAVKQIELDLLRTLPNNKHFHSIKSPGIMRLRQVLTAYSLHNPSVGYCQGMNRLAAVALLFMSEEDAFWCLLAIVEQIMPPNYFFGNLLGTHVDQCVLRDLLMEKMPQLHAHFEKHGIELTFFGWFLTCFVDNTSRDVYLRIWDVFLYEGNKVLFRFALALLKYHSPSLLSIDDPLDLNQYLQMLGYRISDVDHLFHISFNSLDPFPMKTIQAKRQHYTQWVTNEFNKFDQLSKTFSQEVQENYDDSDSE
ncbi:TBC1 domain family member 2B-like [Brevipalpus obovatus]|uniref:TBC1 domain family member 2B-like n=1 Tax=Brevipalpus obovatus TaxID=246614 RepID=UPI003D9E0B90